MEYMESRFLFNHLSVTAGSAVDRREREKKRGSRVSKKIKKRVNEKLTFPNDGCHQPKV